MPEIRGKRARSRMIIMHAAKGLFEEKGINHVTFNDIAQRADMCRTTIFNHFSTINELILALMEQEVDELLDYCSRSKDTGSELIIRLMEKVIDDTVNYPVLAVKLLTDSIITAEERPSIQKVEQLISDNLGDMDEKEKEKRVIMIIGIYCGLVNHCFIAGKPFDGRRMKRQFLEYAKPYLS